MAWSQRRCCLFWKFHDDSSNRFPAMSLTDRVKQLVKLTNRRTSPSRKAPAFRQLLQTIASWQMNARSFTTKGRLLKQRQSNGVANGNDRRWPSVPLILRALQLLPVIVSIVFRFLCDHNYSTVWGRLVPQFRSYVYVVILYKLQLVKRVWCVYGRHG